MILEKHMNGSNNKLPRLIVGRDEKKGEQKRKEEQKEKEEQKRKEEQKEKEDQKRKEESCVEKKLKNKENQDENKLIFLVIDIYFQ